MAYLDSDNVEDLVSDIRTLVETELNLYEGIALAKDDFPATVKTDGLIDISKLKTVGVYHVKNASDFISNIKPFSINGNSYTAQGFKLVVERCTSNTRAIKQTIYSTWENNSGLNDYYRLTIDSSEYPFTDWYPLCQDCSYPYDLSLNSFSSGDANTARVNHVKGGYYKRGKKVYVRIEFTLLSNYRFGAGSYYIYSGFPIAALGNITLRATATSGDAVTSRILGARLGTVGSAANVFLVCSDAFPDATTNTIIIEGEYIAA